MNDRANLPISEQYRLVAKKWVDADAAASLLEECKSAFISKKMAALGDMPVSRAELTVKASAEWTDYVTKMVRAREQAALLKVQLEFIRMQFTEEQGFNATRRAEMRL
jgi:hypothetical protein